MSAQTQNQDEPSYLAFARANVRDAQPSSPAIVSGLLERGDRAVAALAAAQPRTITTLSELEALKVPAIINCTNGGHAKVEYYYGPGLQKYVEFLFGDSDDDHSLAAVADWGLPATVLVEAAQ